MYTQIMKCLIYGHLLSAFLLNERQLDTLNDHKSNEIRFRLCNKND